MWLVLNLNFSLKFISNLLPKIAFFNQFRHEMKMCSGLGFRMSGFNISVYDCLQ